MRKECGILLVIMFFASLSVIEASEFETKNWFAPNNPKIQEIALNLKKSNEIETAAAIWDWMNENITYEYSPKECTVEYTLQTYQGNCANHSYLSASLLLAAGWQVENVRIGEGNGHHAWVEIRTEKWHRFDTTYHHSFEEEYSLQIYQEGKDYTRIDYYYYDPRELPEISLKSSNITILKDIHVIELEIINTGGMRKSINIEVMTNLEIIGNSHNFQFLIESGKSVVTKTYLKGEGPVTIKIDDITFETTLKYPVDPDPPAADPPADNPMIQEQSFQEPTRETISQPTVQIQKITLKKPEKIRKVEIQIKTENQSFNSLYLIFCLPLFCIVLFKKKK